MFHKSNPMVPWSSFLFTDENAKGKVKGEEWCIIKRENNDPMFLSKGLNQVDKGDIVLQDCKCIFVIKSSSPIISLWTVDLSFKSRSGHDRLAIFFFLCSLSSFHQCLQLLWQCLEYLFWIILTLHRNWLKKFLEKHSGLDYHLELKSKAGSGQTTQLLQKNKSLGKF